MLRVDFEELKVEGDTDPNLYAHWTCVKELISALLPDFSLLLWQGKLDSEAIQDCANFVQATVSTARDRNANMWGVLLYFMLLINALFQCSPDDQVAVFDWVVKSATRSIRQITLQGGVIDRFVMSVHRVLQLRTNPLGHESATLSLHNIRKFARPQDLNLRTTGPIQYYAMRVQSVVGVVWQVLRLQFNEQELIREVKRVSKNVKDADYQLGSCLFYDCTCNPYPIKRTVVDELTRISTDIPLTETELEQSMCKMFHSVLFIKKTKYDLLTCDDEDVEPVKDYTSIVIKSANVDQGEYNLYQVATFCDESIWYGYRACDNGPMRNYNGFRNWISCGGPTTPMNLIADVVKRNKAEGFGTIYECYTPIKMLTYLGYELPQLEKVPVCYREIPFQLRNDEGDTLINYKLPPWTKAWYGEDGMGSFLGELPPDQVELMQGINNTVDSLNRVFNTRLIPEEVGEDEQSQSAQSPVYEPPTASSSPARMSDLTNRSVTDRGSTGLSHKRKAKPNQAIKRRKANKFILEEASDEDAQV